MTARTVDALWALLDAIPTETYTASGMVPVEPHRRVAGRAFFPVGRGHAPDREMPFGGVMVLGQDFGNERDLDAVVAAGEETDRVPTWREIRKLLALAEIPLQRCWFTNYIMGVRRGHESNCKGSSPGLRAGLLRRECAQLFARQVEMQEPLAIIVLGSHVPPAIAKDVPVAFTAWQASSFRLRDANDGAVIRDAVIGSVYVPLIVSVLHPCLRGPNLNRRSYGTLVGDEAEQQLLRLVHDHVVGKT